MNVLRTKKISSLEVKEIEYINSLSLCGRNLCKSEFTIVQ